MRYKDRDEAARLLVEKLANFKDRNPLLLAIPRGAVPMAELLAPTYQDITPLYRTEFEGMTFEPVGLKQLQNTLPKLVTQIHKALNDDDRHFLLDLKEGKADWKKFTLPEVQSLPAIQWKLANLERMAPDKRHTAARKLEKVLFS